MSDYIRNYELWKIAKNTGEYKEKYIELKKENRKLKEFIIDIENHFERLENKNFNQMEVINFIKYLSDKLGG